MGTCFAILSDSEFFPDPKDNIMDSLFHQYERVIVESLISSFGLDFLIRDQNGGDVDTIHNVREIDKANPNDDNRMTYKNSSNEIDYNSRENYSKSIKAKYDSDSRYKAINAEYSEQKKAGTLSDAYTGKNLSPNANVDLDHVISTEEIHNDRGRVLAEISGLDLANCRENLKPTDRSINRSMGKKDIDDYLKWLNEKESQRAAEIEKLRNKEEPLTDKEKSLLHKFEQQAAINQEQMKFHNTVARKSYEKKLAIAYYTSPKFAKDLSKAAGTVGLQMGIRQIVGLIFTEIWFSVRAEFENISTPFQLDELLTAIGNGIKKGFINAQGKYKDLINRFKDGAISGILASITTTLCNIFFTTAKNIVRIIRQSYASLVQAAEILFLNPDNYLFGERMRAVSKIIATGASVVVGTVVSEAIRGSGIDLIPDIGDIVPTFCGTFVTGILSCSLLYFLDRSESMNRLVSVLNNVPSMSSEVEYFKRQAIFFEHYAAEIMQIDIKTFKEEADMYLSLASELETVEDENNLNILLKKATKLLGIEIPWGDDFNSFMNDKDAVLVFE